MVVASVVTDHAAASDERLQLIQASQGAFSLRHAELRLDLPAEPARPVADDAGAEAPFAVDESDDPPRSASWPFLLIDRTGRIVTAHVLHPTEGI